MNDLQLATVRNVKKVCELLGVGEAMPEGEVLKEFRIESAKLAVKIITLGKDNQITPDFYQAFCDAIPDNIRGMLLMGLMLVMKQVSDDAEAREKAPRVHRDSL